MYFITTFRSWSTKLLCYRAFGALGIYVGCDGGSNYYMGGHKT